MTHIDKYIERIERQCKDRGVRLTVKRKQVLAGLIRSNKALSAYELIDYCKEHDGNSIPAMSIYRILEFLEDQHLVHKLNLANKYVACAHINCDHEHGIPQFLICGNCSKVEEISIKPAMITALKASVKNAGFKLLSPQLEMNCLCNECAA